MPNITDFPARGRILSHEGGVLTFAPTNTNYELTLLCANYNGPVGALVDGHIRVQGRKLLTVPSGGNFIAPIFGPVKTVQGRVKYADQNQLVVQAGAPVIVELPKEESAIDLNTGAITVGHKINVIVYPGAKFEVVKILGEQPTPSAAAK